MNIGAIICSKGSYTSLEQTWYNSVNSTFQCGQYVSQDIKTKSFRTSKQLLYDH